MSFPDPNEPIPAEEAACAICALPVDERRMHTRFTIMLSAGRVRRGRLHADCTPNDVDAWCEAQGRVPTDALSTKKEGT